MDKFYKISFSTFVTFLIFSFFGLSGLAQTGPAGIGNTSGANGQPKMEMWLDAADLALTNNTPVSAWSDKSGNGNNLSQVGAARPTFKSASDANYNFASVSFDGTDDFLAFDGNMLVGTDYTIILVGSRKSNGRQVIMGGSANNTNQNLHPYFNNGALHSHQYGNDHNGNYTGGTGSLANATTPNFGVFSFKLNSTLPTLNRVIYQNGSVISTRNNNAQLSAFPDAAIGRFLNEFSNIEVAEMIIYSDALSDPQIKILQNHLSSKYALGMDGNDLYAGDTPGNGNFDFGVTGIGQDNSERATESSVKGFYLNATSSLDANGEFILVGEDNAANSVSFSSLGTGVEARWGKAWFVDKTTAGTLGASISFDFIEGIGGQYPAGNKDNYVLLRNVAGTFEQVPVANTNKSVAGSKIVFNVTDANLVDGTYTLGTLNNTDSPILGSPNQIWYSRKTGNWTDPTVWTLDGSAFPAANNPLAELPDATDQVVINNGTTVTMVDNDRTVANIEVIGTLNIAGTNGHNFNEISGIGLIRLSGAAGIGNFPAGSTADFSDNFIGGTVEYFGTGLTITDERTFNNVIVSLSNSTNELVLMSDLLLNGDLTVSRGVLQINDDTSPLVKSLQVNGDVLIDANGSMTVGLGNTRGTFSIAGNVMPATGLYHDIFHQVTFNGNFTNQGTARFTNQSAPVYNEFTSNGAATVTFGGATNNTASLFGITHFYNLIIDKGIDPTFELEINSNNISNFQLFGPNSVGRISNGGFTDENPEVRKALWIYNGTLHLSGNLTISTLSEGSQNGGNGDYPIGANAGLWIDGPNVSVYTTADVAAQVPVGATGINGGGGNQALSLYGKFRISDGLFGTRGSAGFIFWNASAGEVLIEGGTVNVSQFRSAQSGNSTYSYTQTGGDVLVRANEGVPGEVSGTYDLFSLDIPEAVFNMSGGNLTVYGNRGDAIFINSKPGNFNVTGGTVTVENRNGNTGTIASTAPFWNLTLRKDQAGDAGEIDLITSTSGGVTITNPDLVVLNDFFIGPDITFDHNGNDVKVGSDFTVSSGAEYVFAESKPNTLTLNGIDNSKIALLNINGGGGANEVQQFYNLTINKPHGKVVTLQSNKTGNNLRSFRNNLFRVDGEAFKLLSGTLDQGVHSILANCDTLLNYDVLTVYNEAIGPGGANDVDDNANGNNDQLKLASNQGTPTNIVLITSDTAVIGNLKFFMQNNIVNLNSDLTIQYLQHNNGRFNIQDNNLRVLYYNENPPDAVSAGSLTNMIVTNGQPSDGGLTLAVRVNRTYTFQMGIGLTGANPASKYTPARATISSISDGGFITIRPVDRILATTLSSGGDILSYYWRVNHEDFTTVPNVVYNFDYNQNDVDGSTNEGSFVAGKVLEVVPYTRSFETGGVNASTNRITFDGPSGTGFAVENASYTAGQSGRFVGAPRVYYSRGPYNSTGQAWNQNNRWSTVGHYSATNAGSFPQAGDIAILGFGLQNSNSTTDNGQRSHWYFIDSNTEVAKLVFANEVENSNGVVVPRDQSFTPQLIINDDPAINVSFGTVEGEGSFNVEVNCAPCSTNPNTSVARVANISGDFGLFANEVGSRYDYDLMFSNDRVVRLPSTFPTVYPNLHIKGDGGNNRVLMIAQDIEVKRDLVLRQDAILRLNDGIQGNIVVNRNLDFTINNGDQTLEFSSTGSNRTIRINGDIITNTNDRIRVLNNSPSSLIHKLQLGGSIVQSAGTTIDLFNGLGAANNAILEFVGDQNANYTRAGGNVLDLYQIVMNKNSKSNGFSFNSSFTLGAPADNIVKPISLTRGTLVLNSPGINVNLTTGGDNFNIPESAVFQVTSGTVNASGDNTGVFLDGSLIIDGGTVNLAGAGNGNNFIEYSSSGSARIDISSGFLIVGSQIRGNTVTTAGVLDYRQTGGTVVVGQNAAPVSDRGVFEIKNTGSNFTYTGGTLTLVRQNSGAPTVAALRILPSSFNITQPIYIGNSSTPAGQSDFGINANVPLNGLVISGNNAPTAIIKVNTLTLNGELLINTGSNFNANGIDLIANSNFTNNGTFIPNGNTTTFSSTSTQVLSGTSISNFFKFTKLNNGVLDIDDNGIIVNDLFSHESGIINDNGNTINLRSNAVIEGDMTSAGGEGVRFSGVAQQQLQRLTAGTSNLGVVTIGNVAGVIIPESNGFNYLIEGDLRMNGGIFNIGSSAVTIGQNGNITTNGSFSETNMVKTNSSFSDNGLVKIFSSGFSSNFTFPIGEEFYTPVTFNFSIPGGTSGSSVGSISARPANEFHPTINDGDNFYASDINNVLQYYWTIRSSGINGLVADVGFNYDQSHVLTEDAAVTEATYIAARILDFDNANRDINKFTINEVVEASNIINFPAVLAFNGVSSNGIAGDYFAGDDRAIPDRVATYTTQLALGDVNNTNTYVEGLPTDGVAPSGAVLIVSSGTEVTFNVENVQLYRTIIESGATLNINNTDGHRLGVLEGTGNLKITSNSNNAPLPPADYGTFFSCAGGGLEYAGTGSYNVLSGVNTLRNLTLSGSGNRNFPNNNITICEDLVIDGPTVNGSSNRRILVENSVILNNGTLNVPSGSQGEFFVRSGDLVINGGLYRGGSSGGRTVIAQNIFINGGTLNAGSLGYNFELAKNMTFNAGSSNFNANQAFFEIRNFSAFANSVESSIITGDFSGTNAFRNVRILKDQSEGNVIFADDIEINGRLELVDGLIVTNGNSVVLGSTATVSPASGRSNSYITGKVSKPLSAGSNFTFPIGSIDRWRPTTLYGVNGGYTWEAQFFAANVVTNTIVDDMSTSDGAIETLQQGEYYVISDNASGGTASSVGLSWGTETDVANNSSDRGQLKVMVFNTATSQWDNIGGANITGSQSNGSLRSTSAQSFSEKIFIIGSTDPANPLPVELTYFRANNSRTSVDLEWQTASEFNNDFFEVQRSFDGKDFEVIGIVEGNGTSQQTTNYDFIDYSPLSGDSYYRLRQVDYNGDYEYSPVAKVNRVEETDLMLVPNPTSTQNINLRLSGFHGEQKVFVKIYNVTGKLFYTGVHDPLELQQKALPIRTEMIPGIYMVEIVQGNTKKQVRLAIR